MALTAASFTAADYYEGTGSSTSDSVGLDPGAAPGDWHLLACALTASGGSIDTPVGWTAIQASLTSTASTSHCAAVFARKFVAGDSAPVINHSSGRFAAISVLVKSADAANFLDQSAVSDTTAAVGATAVSAPSRTPGTSSAVLVTVHTGRSNVNGDYVQFSAPTGMTLIQFAGTYYTGSNAGVGVSVVAVGSGVASGAKSAAVAVPTNGAIGISFVVRNATASLTSVTSTRSSTWGISARVTDTASSAWNVLELAHITATRASAWNDIGTITATKASAWTARVSITNTRATGFNVVSAAGGGAPLGQFMIRYVAYDPNGARRGVVAKPLESSVGFPVNDLPALSIGYSTAAVGFPFIATACEVAVEWSINGSTWTEAPNGRFLRIKRGDDATDTNGKVTYECPGYLWLLTKAKIWPGALDNADGQRVFAGQRPGSLMKTLINEVKARGGLAGLTFDFTDLLDSNGQTWAQTIPSITFDTGANLLDVLQSLADQGLVDFLAQGRTLRMFNPNTYLARDVTTGAAPVTLALGRDITDAPDTGTLEDVATDLVVVGDSGVKTTLTNASAVSPWGRWESYMSQSGVTDAGTLAVLGQSELAKTGQERVENTRALTFATAVWLPFNNYRMGDYLKAPGDAGTLATLRVMQITLGTSENGVVTGAVTLNDRFTDKALRDSRRLAGVLNGASGTGGTGGTPAPPPTVDRTIPASPLGLSASTFLVQLPDGTSYATVTLGWGSVTKNTDGSTMTDFRGYEVWQKRNAYGEIWHRRTFIEGTDTSLNMSPFDPGSQWIFTVKARDVTGNTSANATPYTYVTMAADTTGPNAPSAPIVTPYLGQLVVAWNGKDSSGAGMPVDWVRTEIHMSTTSGFTPSASTVKGAVVAYAGGQFLLSGLPYDQQVYVRLVAYDRAGNASPASAQVTGTPTRVANVDVGDGTINGVKIQPGTITATMALFAQAAIQRADIALLAVDDARIANLAVGKLVTGELSATTRVIAGQDAADHAEMRADGFAVVSHDVNGDAYDVVRMGNATTNFFTIPDPTQPETTLASIDSAGNAAFQGLDVAGVDDTDTGATIYGRDFSEWLDDKADGNAAFVYNLGSTTPIDATAEIVVAEVSFTYREGRHFTCWWGGMHYYSNTTIVGGQFRMVYTNDGSQPTSTHGATAATQFVVPNNTTSIGNFGTSPPMFASGDWGGDGDTIRVAITARRYYGTGIFNVLTSGGAVYQNPYRLFVVDEGPIQANSWQTPGATGKKTYVKTFPATYTRLFRATGTARSDTTNAVQGYDKVYGDSRAYIGFADMTSTLSGVAAADVKKVEVYLYCNYTGLTTGGTAKIGFHGFATAPVTMGAMTTQLSTHFNRPQGRWVTLPLVTPGNWVTGTWRGITLGPAGTTSATYYMRFNGYSNSAYKPQMRITYVK